MNYLQLCNEIVYELGLQNGSGLTTTVGQTGELNNVTRWIRDAALYVDNLWLDWRYLWNQYSEPVAANANVLPAPTTMPRLWDINSIYYQPQSGGLWQQLPYMTRERMRLQYDPLNAVANPPSVFTIQPNNTLVLNCPTDQAYNFVGEFWQQPVALALDTDVPLMPANYHRIIVARAAVMYGNREDAPEVISGLSAEYVDILDKMESDQLEHQSLRRSSTDRERGTPQETLNRWL